MTDTKTPAAINPNETPIQRALRQKNEAQAAREQAPRGGAFQREQNKRITSGKSRPWMTK